MVEEWSLGKMELAGGKADNETEKQRNGESVF